MKKLHVILILLLMSGFFGEGLYPASRARVVRQREGDENAFYSKGGRKEGTPDLRERVKINESGSSVRKRGASRTRVVRAREEDVDGTDEHRLQVSKSHREEGAVFSEVALKNVAEVQGYGYKYANLVELQKLTSKFNNTPGSGIKIEIPEFFGVSSGQVVAALQSVAFDVAARWVQVLSTIKAKDRQLIFKSKQMPQNFWIEQKNFIGALSVAFDRLKAEDLFGRDEEMLGKISRFLALSAADGLMVRSTGKEDTREMANAGGNESIANVAPTMAAVAQAAKEVVISYFSEKSLE